MDHNCSGLHGDNHKDWHRNACKLKLVFLSDDELFVVDYYKIDENRSLCSPSRSHTTKMIDPYSNYGDLG